MNAHSITSPAPPQQAPDIASSIAFLKELDPTGYHNLVSFEYSGVPERFNVEGKTFPPGAWNEMARWISSRVGTCNLYFSLNEPIPSAPDHKLKKEHIKAIRGLPLDVDPDDAFGTDINAARSAIAERMGRLNSGTVPPTITLDSGGGAQALWLLSEKLDAVEHLSWAEDQGRAIAYTAGGDAVQNIDRILRLPGSVNRPGWAKLAKGRVPRTAMITGRTGRRYEPSEISAAFPPVTRVVDDHSAEVAAARAELDGEDLFVVPTKLKAEFEAARRASRELDLVYRGDPAGLIGTDASGSGFRCSFARRLAELGFGCVDYARLVLAWDIPQVDQDKIDPNTWQGVRALSRDWGKFGAPNTPEAKAAREAKWHEELADSGAAKAGSTREGGFDFDSATQLRLFDLQNIPKKEFNLGTRFQPGTLTLGIGPAGVSKSMFAMLSAAAIATGRPLTGELVSKTGPVLIYDAETPIDEMRRRLKALASFHNLPLDKVLSQIRLLSGHDQLRLVIAERKVRQNPIVASRHFAGLRDFILDAAIVHLVLDPLVSLHRGLEENDASDMDVLADFLKGLAQQTGTSIDLIHHSVKNRTGQSEHNAGSADASRGSGAVIAAVRSAYTFARMSVKTATDLQLPPDRAAQMIRIDDAKRNNTRSSAREKWFEILSVLPSGQVIPGWHFEANDPALRAKALESVGVHTPFDAHHQRTIAALDRVGDAEAQRRGLLSFLIGEMKDDRVGRIYLVNALMAARGVSETTARTMIDEAVPVDRPRAVEAAGETINYRLWRTNQKRPGRQSGWVICREVCGQIVRDVPVAEGPVGDDGDSEGGVFG